MDETGTDNSGASARLTSQYLTLIGQTTLLTFKAIKIIIRLAAACLITFGAVAADLPSSAVFQMRLVADAPSDETELMTLVHQRDGKTNGETLYVSRAASLDQTALKSVKVIAESGTSGSRIQIVFTEKGQKEFAELTRTSIGKRLAIIIEGRLYAAPVIRTAITGGIGEISGTFTEKEAEGLAAKITKPMASP